jgi:hypothetical protein
MVAQEALLQATYVGKYERQKPAHSKSKSAPNVFGGVSDNFFYLSLATEIVVHPIVWDSDSTSLLWHLYKLDCSKYMASYQSLKRTVMTMRKRR